MKELRDEGETTLIRVSKRIYPHTEAIEKHRNKMKMKIVIYELINKRKNRSLFQGTPVLFY